MAALNVEADRAYVCGCGCGYSFIVTYFNSDKEFRLWMFEQNTWVVYDGPGWEFGRPTPHPDPDRFHAEFAAAQLLGKVNECS